jgi:NAD+ synthase (glutamine-hydrolysing)
MRVTIGQINTTNGDVDGNVAKILSAIERAKSDGSEMIVFPEVATHGYTSFDWFLDKDIIETVEKPLEKIIPATKGITAIVGTVRKTGDANGKRLFNSAAVISDGKLLGFADKTLLPEYDVFDDPRYFEPSNVRKMFEINGSKIGVVVCEDFWNDKTFWKERLYETDPADELIMQGADLIVAAD